MVCKQEPMLCQAIGRDTPVEVYSYKQIWDLNLFGPNQVLVDNLNVHYLKFGECDE